MIVGDRKHNKTYLKTFMPLIKKDKSEWHVLNVRVGRRSEKTLRTLAEVIAQKYQDKEGLIITVSDYKLSIIIQLGENPNYTKYKEEIAKFVPNSDCKILAGRFTKAQLNHIRVDMDRDIKLESNLFYDNREKRAKNIAMVVDDDMFVRQVLRKLLEKTSTVCDIENGDTVIQNYQEYNPDIIFLDLHMPGKNGLDLMEDIFELDTDAHIIIFSSDTVAENVHEALSRGAAGFLAKPIKQDKVKECLRQCITYKT